MFTSILTFPRASRTHPDSAGHDRDHAGPDRQPAPGEASMSDSVAAEAWEFLAGQLAWEVRLDQLRRAVDGEIAPDRRVRIQTPEAA